MPSPITSRLGLICMQADQSSEMASYKKIGPLTIEVSPGRPAEGDRPAVSGIYRNIAAADGFVTDVRGSKTLFEIFEKSVQENGDRKCVEWEVTAVVLCLLTRRGGFGRRRIFGKGLGVRVCWQCVPGAWGLGGHCGDECWWCVSGGEGGRHLVLSRAVAVNLMMGWSLMGARMIARLFTHYVDPRTASPPQVPGLAPGGRRRQARRV